LGFGIYNVTLDANTSVAAATAYYSSRPGVLDAEVDAPIHVAQTPNDPSYSQEWAMPKIGAPAAWDVATGSSKFVVATTATGVDYTHPDLAQNIWINQGEIPSSIKSHLVDVDGDGLITFRDLNSPTNSAWVHDNNGNGYIDGGDLLRPIAQNG